MGSAVEDQALPEDDARPEIDNQEVEQPEVEESEVTETETEESEAKPTGEERLISKYAATKHQKRELEEQNKELAKQLEEAKRERELALLAVDPVEEDKADAPPRMPKPSDYDYDDDQFQAAMDKWNVQNTQYIVKQTQSVAQEEIKNSNASREQQQAQQHQEKEYQKKVESHYERADALGADDFVEVEDQLKEKLVSQCGEDAANHFMDHVIEIYPDMSEQLAYQLGKDAKKADEIIGASLENWEVGKRLLNSYADSIKSKFKQGGDPLPNPDEPIEGGAGGGLNNYEESLEKKRELVSKGKLSFQALQEWKKANRPKDAA